MWEESNRVARAAIKYFSEQAVDLVILETGLGGRLDSTNVIKPEVCGITQISLDHMNVLGKTPLAAKVPPLILRLTWLRLTKLHDGLHFDGRRGFARRCEWPKP